MNVLCVCSAGMNRSKHLAKFLHEKGHETDFAGVHPLSLNQVTQHRLDWADVIICVRPWMEESLREGYDVRKKIITLDISNRESKYKRMEREALEALQRS